MNITWICKPFTQLLPQELYSILRLRSEVFVVEQNCVYLDPDNKDQDSFHLCGWEEDNLIAYARVMPQGLAYSQPSIGRVVTSGAVRKKGVGKILMETAIKETIELLGESSITIGAQLYLKHFYESLGFQQSGELYLEDGIEHIKMQRK